MHLAVVCQQCNSTLILTWWVYSVNEVTLVVVAKHQFEHGVWCVVYNSIMTHPTQCWVVVCDSLSVDLLQQLFNSPQVSGVNNPVGESVGVGVSVFLHSVNPVSVEVQHIVNQPPDNLKGL